MKKVLLIITGLLIFYTSYGQKDSLKNIHVALSLPYINGFHVVANDSIRKNWGFWGISTEIEYGSQHRAWSVQIGAITDFFAPIGPADIEGRYESLNAFFLDLSRKHISEYSVFVNQYEWSNPAELLYGINYSVYNWKLQDTFSEQLILEKETKNSFGAHIGVRIFVGNWFFLSYQYRPTFLNFSKKIMYDYQHTMSFGFGIKI